MFLYKNFLKLFTLIFLGGFFSSNTFAALVFTNEENGTHESQFFIDSGDVSTDFIDLEFGTSNTAKLRFDIPNDKFIFNRDLNLSSQKKLVFSDADNSNTASIQAPTNIPTDYTLTLPDNDGNPGEVLVSDGSGNLSWSEISGDIAPNFKVGRNTTQSIPSGSWTKVLWETENFDSNDDFDMVNGKFTPRIPGKYLLTAQVRFENVGDSSSTYMAIRKNNGGIVNDYKNGTGNYRTNRVSVVIDADGDDYFEVFVYQNSGSNKNINASPVWSLFSGSRIDGGNGHWTKNGSDIGYNTGNVGIGTTNPSGNFHVITTKTTPGGYTSDVTGSGTASADQEYNNGDGTGAASKTFDDNTDTEGWGNNNSLPTWLKYDFGASNEKTITKYTLFRSTNQTGGWNSDNYSPKNWTIEGSNDNSNWTTVDTQTNQLVSPGAAKSEYTFSNDTAYRYYRINISAAYSGTWINITEVEMMESLPPTTSDDDTLFVNDGKIGVGTTSPSQTLDVYGNIAVSGTTVHTSDIRKKENIFTLENSLNDISKIRGVKFNWKDKSFDNRKQIGVIAQEIEKVYPELVYTNNDKNHTKSVNYEGLIPPLIEAIKELNNKNNLLFEEIESLKNLNKENNNQLHFGK